MNPSDPLAWPLVGRGTVVCRHGVYYRLEIRQHPVTGQLIPCTYPLPAYLRRNPHLTPSSAHNENNHVPAKIVGRRADILISDDIEAPTEDEGC